jgi:hypothetical protein
MIPSRCLVRAAEIGLGILGLWLGSGVGVAYAQTCHVTDPRYQLSGDTVRWAMIVRTGSSCIHGVRFGNVVFDKLTLISPPRVGVVELQGPGFVYSAKANFEGEDSFSLAVLGVANGKRGSSTIRVTVSVGPEYVPDASPKGIPSVSVIEPHQGATISGSRVVLAADVSGKVPIANVQFIVGTKEIGSAVTSPPYEIVWDSTAVVDGAYSVFAVAQDTAGGSEIAIVQIVVKNK